MDETFNLEVVVFRQEPDGTLVLEAGEPVTDRQVAVALLAARAVPRGTLERVGT